MSVKFTAPSLFRKRVSKNSMLLKKMEIVTSPHMPEPSWGIVVQLTDAMDDPKVAKLLLSHCAKILQKSINIR